MHLSKIPSFLADSRPQQWEMMTDASTAQSFQFLLKADAVSVNVTEQRPVELLLRRAQNMERGLAN